MVTTNGSRKSNFSNEGISNTKQSCEVEQQNNKSESENTKDSIDKNMVDNTTVENESELVSSTHKINKCNFFNEDSHEYQSSVYKEAESVTDETTISNDK